MPSFETMEHQVSGGMGEAVDEHIAPQGQIESGGQIRTCNQRIVNCARSCRQVIEGSDVVGQGNG